MDEKRERNWLFLVGAVPVWATFVIASHTFYFDPDGQLVFLAFVATPPACAFISLLVRLLNYWSAKHPPGHS